MQKESKYSYLTNMVIYLLFAVLCGLFWGIIFSIVSGITSLVMIVSCIFTIFTFFMLVFIPICSTSKNALK